MRPIEIENKIVGTIMPPNRQSDGSFDSGVVSIQQINNLSQSPDVI
jgi:hypothetical protein